jgi:periplasmic divalent cation tolerance protein
MAPEPSGTPSPSTPTGKFAVVWSTYPDAVAAERAANDLVERRLAACVAILPQMVSVYRWQGAIERSNEAVLIAKTRATSAEAVTAALAASHPYEVPALLVLPVAAASAAYGAWIEAETDP